MAEVENDKILKALEKIVDPDKGQDIVSLDMISGIVCQNGNIGFTIEVDAGRGKKMEPLRLAAEKAVMAIPGVISVTAVLTAAIAENN